MDELIDELLALEAEKKVVEKDIYGTKKEMHENFVKKRRIALKTMDYFVFLIVMFNFGAIAITNYVVDHKIEGVPGQEVEFKEVNPVAAEIQQLEVAPEAKNPIFIRTALIYLLIWIGLIGIYVAVRRNIYLDAQFTVLIFIVAVYFTMTGHDFFNNLGHFMAWLELR